MSSAGTYTAEDIERYHRGEMSAAERHLLEKAALDDPMLADALEGYTYTATPKADLTQLQNRLQQRLKSDKKNRSVPMQSWLRIAALFVLLAGGGWLVFLTLSTKENSIATTRKDNAIQEETTNAKIDSAAHTDASTAAILPADSIAVTSITTAKRATKPATVAAPQSQPATIPAEGITAMREQSTSPATEKVMARAAEIAAVKDNSATQIDRIASDTIPQNDVARQKNETRGEENGAPKRRLQTSAKMIKVAYTAEPVEGLTYFKNYITTQRKAAGLRKELPAKGEVELAFTVNRNGTPIDITVTKSLCKPCDDAAIKLLENGPKWKESGEKGTVKIRL